MYSLEAQIIVLENRTTDPTEQVGRMYFNTVDNRPKIAIREE